MGLRLVLKSGSLSGSLSGPLSGPLAGPLAGQAEIIEVIEGLVREYMVGAGR